MNNIKKNTIIKSAYKFFFLIFWISNLIPGQLADSNPSEIYKIRLKSREFTPSKNILSKSLANSINKNHVLLQFNDKLTIEIRNKLKSSGIEIDSWVSTTTIAVNITDLSQLEEIENIRWIGELGKNDKLSEKLQFIENEIFIIAELHGSLHKDNYLNLIKSTGAQVLNNVYLNVNTLLLKVDSETLDKLSALNEVSYLYPAPQKVIEGKKVRQCSGAATQYGFVGAFVTNGVGWDGPGIGSADLKYYWVNGTPDVEEENSEVLAAMLHWSDYVDIDWSKASIPGLGKSIDVYWQTEAPFENADPTFGIPSGVLAYGYYPDDIVNEPIAGNIYFDEAESWRIGDDFDIFTVALHEVGHTLGLAHSDETDAVMAAFYTSPVGDLRADDINGIRLLYSSINTPRTSAPIFDPTSGAYESPIEVRLEYGEGSDFNNTQIKYTIDGSEPTPYSFDIIPDFDDYIFQRLSNTVKARAFRINHTPSEVVEVTYVLTPATPTVQIPTINPNGGTFNSSVQVALDSETEFTVIRYTTDGSEPTQSSFAYAGPLTLVSSTSLKAKGFRNEYSPSPTASAYFNIITEVNKPQFYPLSGQVYVGAVNVNIESTTLGASIRYTLDGSEPNASSTIYNGPILISNSITIRAKGFLEGAIDSEIGEATYYIISNVANPSISPVGGQHTGNIQVTISSSTPNSVIRYTTNGTEVTSFSDIYSGSFTLGTGNHWICAKAYLEGADPSDITCVNYDIFNPDANTVEIPTMAPFSTQTFVNEIPISMDCRTEGVTIRYTVGSNIIPHDPPESGPGALTYTEPFNFGVPGGEISFFFKVRAFKDGLNPSPIIQSGALKLVVPLGIIEKPVIFPSGGIYNNSIEVTLSTSSEFAQIIFTENGEEPNSLLPILSPSRVFNNPFIISRPKTIIAKAFRKFFEDSDTAKAIYFFKCAQPIITPNNGNFTDSVTVMMSTETLNSKIRYTLDGTLPDENSDEYSEPLILGLGNYSIKAKAFRNNFLESESSSSEFVIEKIAELPQIINDLQGITATEGEKIVFKIQASGTPVPTFQWQRNQVNLPQETADSLVLENIQLGDAGEYRVIISNSAGEIISEEVSLTVNSLTSISEIALEGIPSAHKLYGNYPNPFNPSTRIQYGVSEESSVSLFIFNIIGEKITILTNEIKQGGNYEIHWNASNLSSGIYFLKFIASAVHTNNEINSVHKLLLIK